MHDALYRPNDRQSDRQLSDGSLGAAISAAQDLASVEGLRSQLLALSDADMAELLTYLTPEDRMRVIPFLGDDFRATVLSELDVSVKDALMEALSNEQVAAAVADLDTDDAVYLLEDMDDADQSEVLARLPAEDRAALERSLDYPEESAGRMMQADFIAIPPFWTVGQAIDHMRETADLPERFTALYVVDASYHLLGTVALDRILRSRRPIAIATLMETEGHAISAELDRESVAVQFERHNLMAAPVVDEDQRMIGVVTADDVVEVIQEEAERDIRQLAGIGDEAVSDTALTIAPARLLWLFINLLTAIFASSVIALFDASIEQMVALAVLMPIVASMGGNAGTQTMTVTVRALATEQLGAGNLNRFIGREMLIGLLNGIVFAAIMAVVVLIWFGNDRLGLVIAAAMVCNLVVAALAGIVIPLALSWRGIDPAVASTVFVTTVTDVVGFMAFLGLASWLLF
jgi:magnesium transporter